MLFKLLCYFSMLAILFISVQGCSDHSSDTSEPVKKEFNLGESVNQSIKTYLKQSDHANLTLNAYRPHESGVITGINQLVAYQGKKITGTSQHILRALYRLVETNTLPNATNAIGKLLQEILKDPKTIQAIADYLNTRNGTDAENLLALVHQISTYEKGQELWQATAQLVAKNPMLLKHLCEFMHDLLTNFPEDPCTEELFHFLAQRFQGYDMGTSSPVWIASLDINDNPKVQRCGDSLFLPFSDRDNDGVCDVNAAGRPIDVDGTELDIPAFSNRKYYDANGNLLIDRDSQGRAISPDNDLIFEYYDAKQTVLALVMYQVGRAFQGELPENLLTLCTQALGDKVVQHDAAGSYLGYSLDSHLCQGISQILELCRNEQVHFMLRGANVIVQNQEPGMVLEAIQGLWAMLIQELRDNPKITSADDLCKWFEGFADNPPPQIFPLLQLMSMTEIPECPYPNMAMLFFYWISNNYNEISQGLWPILVVLRDIENTHPGLTNAVATEVIQWSQWAFIARVSASEQTFETKPIAAVALQRILNKFLANPDDNINAIKQALQTHLPSRKFANLIECLHNFTPYSIFKQAIVSFLTPTPEADQDVYSELVRVHVGMIQCRKAIATKVRLFKLLGGFFDPQLPLMENLLTAFHSLAMVDKEFVILQMIQNATGTNENLDKPPLAIFASAYLDVLQSIPEQRQRRYDEISSNDVRCLLQNMVDFTLSEGGLLQRLYNVIRKNVNQY